MSDASTLDLQTVRGDVVIEAWDNDQVEISERLRVDDRDYDRDDIEVEITITDPSGDYASTASTSHGGSIRIEERR